jgi:hypothetical protein
MGGGGWESEGEALEDDNVDIHHAGSAFGPRPWGGAVQLVGSGAHW